MYAWEIFRKWIYQNDNFDIPFEEGTQLITLESNTRSENGSIYIKKKN